MGTRSGEAQALWPQHSKQNNLTDVGVIRRQDTSQCPSHRTWHHAASFPFVLPPLSPRFLSSPSSSPLSPIFSLLFSPVYIFLSFFLLAHWRAMGILFAFISSILPFFPSWSEYLFFSGLCSALILDEAVQYVCFHTIMGSSVVCCNSLRHSLCAIVSQGRCYGAHSDTRVANSLIRALNSRSKDCYWSRI